MKRRRSGEAPAGAAAPAAGQPPAKKVKGNNKEVKPAAKGTVGGATAGSWTKLGLSDGSFKFLTEDKGFETMAPVQAAAIPQLLRGKDVVVEAVTGSGKTLAFLVPAFEMCQRPAVAETIRENKHAMIALIVLPTRELAIQVEREASAFAAYLEKDCGLPIAVNSFIGGREGARDVASYEKKGANVAVGTPGRLYELMVLGMDGIDMTCKTLELLVLDEADRLLSQGFRAKLDAIIHRIPHQRRTGLFSATQTNEVKELVRVGMRNPVVVKVQVKKKDGTKAAAGQMNVPETLRSYYRIIKPSAKLEALSKFVQENPKSKVIVYFLTCACVDFATRAMAAGSGEAFRELGVTVYSLHGQLPLQKRKKIFTDFKTSATGGVLLATDVAARGLDVADIDWVFQLDAPQDPATYVHRIGRTARMGKTGSCMIYLSPHEASYIEYLALQKVAVERCEAVDGLGAESDEEASDNEGAENDDDAGVDDEAAADGATLDQATGMKHNPKGAVRFRVRVANRGMRKKFQAKNNRIQKKGLAPEPVIIGKGCDSNFVYRVRKQLSVDRDLNDIAVKAFVTWVRAYRDHQLRYIFKLGRVDVIDLCHAFGLLRMPKMPELAHMSAARLPIEAEFQSINPLNIKCVTEEQEAKRQDKLKAKAEQRKTEMSERNKKREEIKQDASLGRRAKKAAWSQMELDELNDDARLMKKLRQGKITEAEYAKLSGEDEFEFSLMNPKERRKARAKKEQEEEEARKALEEAEARGDDADMSDDDDDLLGADEVSSASSEPESEAPPEPKLPDNVEKSKSGHAPASWIAMIKKKMGR